MAKPKESMFHELKRYVRFETVDEDALRGFSSAAAAYHPRIVDHFYERLLEHEAARRVLRDQAQIERLKGTLRDWLTLLLSGPWDDAYYEKRARIGRIHVKIALPQRYMFGAMSLIRIELLQIAQEHVSDATERCTLIAALQKILDLELAIMLESYREAFVDVRTRRAERLVALGTMAAGLAHELRNPLNSAHLQLNVAERKLARNAAPDLEGAQCAVELAQTEMNRLAGLVEDFLRFAEPQALRLKSVDLRSLVEATLAFMAPEARAAEVSLVLDPGGPVLVEIDDEKMHQVLLCLLRNAIEASLARGVVSVHVDVSGGVAHVRVEDHGTGIAANAPVFEPFFTTKPQGTGLGLAIAHRIVLDHGGSVGVESAPGHTVFSVSLPRGAADSVHPAAAEGGA